MKKIILLLFLTCFFLMSEAQRFFYIESNQLADKLLEDGLRKSAQFVVKSALISDYIINTSYEYLTGQDIIKMKMDVKDSVTLATIFHANEDYTLGAVNKNSPVVAWLAIQNFLQKNISLMVPESNADHFERRMKYDKPKKDKT
jgi:hypothetical protein